jgi:hypothetical protein
LVAAFLQLASPRPPLAAPPLLARLLQPLHFPAENSVCSPANPTPPQTVFNHPIKYGRTCQNFFAIRSSSALQTGFFPCNAAFFRRVESFKVDAT